MRLKPILTSLSILLATGLGMANAATIINEGAASPFTAGGSPDGWSGVSVLETAVIDADTEGGLVEITEVSMFAGAGRAGGSHHVQAILVDSSNLITWISPELTPTQDGLNVFPITGAGTIDATGGPLRLGLWQWNDGVDDSAGGTVAFAGGGGGGMFQQNLNGTLGADAISIGHEVTSQHASGAGGRDYHFSVVATAVGATTDGDGDGLPDSWETANNLDPDDNGENPNNNGLAGDPDQGAAGDPDNDNLTNFEEFELGTDPQEDDTDMDGLLDGVESNTGTWNGADDTGTDPDNADSDDDGLSDGVENPDLAHNPLDPSQQPGTNPNLADTDGDGKDDGAELADGTDPTDENDGGLVAAESVLIGEGAERPFTAGGSPDGWSGVSVLETAIIDSTTVPGVGDLVEITEVSMFAGAGRAAGTHHLIPLLIDSADQIAWIGPELTPTQDGHNVFPITGAELVDVSADTYRLGLWQWNDGVDDSAGGTVAFAGGGGGGMFQQNLNGTLGADAISIGHEVTSQHASGAGGRDYHIDVLASRVVTADGDGDGLPDSWETANNLDPNDNGEDPNNNGVAGDPSQGADGDPDSDGLTNLEELILHTDPQENDTDMDGLLDGVESNTGTWNGSDDTGTDPTNADSDDDGLSDGVENPDLAHNRLDPGQQPGTDPNLADTDGDGKDDSVELADGTDPTNTNDVLVPTGVLVGDGAERPFATGGGADGWSGISVLETAIIDDSTLPGAGDLVEVLEVSMLAAGGRHGGTHHFMPLLIDSSNQIAWIGPELTPTQAGHNVFPITGADPVDVSTDTYRLGVWQWNDGQDDNAGGTIAFAGGGGGGMFQQNLNGTLGADAISIGHEVTTGHSSGAGGRDYQIDVLVGLSEPNVIILTDVSSDPGAGTLSLSWESKAGELYNLRSEADPAQIAAVAPLDWPIFGGNVDIAATPPENTLTIPMPDDLTRLFVVEGFPAPPVTLFTDDLESGAEGWTTVVNDAIGSTRWELGSPSGSTGPLAGADDSASAWSTNLGDYGPNSDISLRSPAFDLSGVASAELTFKAFRDADGFGDSAVVRFLRAADFVQLGGETALDMTIFDVDYTNLEVPVPAEALGENVIIEWNFVSDGSADNFSGLSIDDIEVIE